MKLIDITPLLSLSYPLDSTIHAATYVLHRDWKQPFLCTLMLFSVMQSSFMSEGGEWPLAFAGGIEAGATFCSDEWEHLPFTITAVFPRMKVKVDGALTQC